MLTEDGLIIPIRHGHDVVIVAGRREHVFSGRTHHDAPQAGNVAPHVRLRRRQQTGSGLRGGPRGSHRAGCKQSKRLSAIYSAELRPHEVTINDELRDAARAGHRISRCSAIHRPFFGVAMLIRSVPVA